MSRRADIILALVSSTNGKISTQEKEGHGDNVVYNLKRAEDGLETNKVDELFEYEGEEARLFSSESSHEEEYLPDLSELSSSDEDASFTRKVKTEIEEKTRKRKRSFQLSSDEDIIPGTDSDSDRPSFPFKRIGRKNNTSASLNHSNEIDEQGEKSNRNTQSEVIGNPSEEQVIEPLKKKNKIFNLPPKQSRKKYPMPDTWKKNKAKLARERGKSYVNYKGKIVEEKTVNEGILCQENCRFKCNDISIEDRKEILASFYNLDINSKNNLLFKSIVPVNVERPNTLVKIKNKSQSYHFYIRNKNEEKRVCKKALCSLYQIGKKKIELLQEKMKDGISAPPPDKRGFHTSRPHKIPIDVVRYIQQHIKSFPSEASHYSRNVNAYKKYLSPLLNISKMHKLYIDLCELENKPEYFRVKISFYRTIFDRDFNLSFGHPRSDTCSTCDAGENTEEHQENYKEAFALQKKDRETAKNTEKMCYVTVDLQQTMPLPKLTTSKAFYLRQLWFYNLGVHIITKETEKADFCTWTEDVANRGSNEVASSLLTLFELDTSLINSNHLIIWSDSCSGQNKNFLLILLYQYLVAKNMFKIIDHKFPEVGHSYLDSDRDFGRVEKELRKHENVYVPNQYREIISKSAKKNFVVDMSTHFRDFEGFSDKLGLKQSKKDLLEEPVRFRDGIKWIRVDEFGSYLYKETYDENTPFKKVSLLKQDRKGTKAKNKNGNDHRTLSENVLKNVFVERKENRYGTVTKEKLNNLKTQLKYVKGEHQWFYQKLIEEQEKKYQEKEADEEAQMNQE